MSWGLRSTYFYILESRKWKDSRLNSRRRGEFHLWTCAPGFARGSQRLQNETSGPSTVARAAPGFGVTARVRTLRPVRPLRLLSWASFHDRVSGAAPPEVDPVVHTSARLDDAAVVRRFYPDLAERAGAAGAAGAAGERDELLDHLPEGFFPAERPHAYFSWELMPGVFHLIEATCGARSDTGTLLVRHE
jgi:hypothetical protein